jgi:LemA protein
MWVVVAVGLTIGAIFLIKYWIETFNILQNLKTMCDKLCANIDSIKQQRLDNLLFLAKSTKQYSSHEFDTLEKTIEARSKGKSVDNEEFKKFMFGIQALVEQYPNLKADEMFNDLMDKDYEIETILRKARIEYNEKLQEFIQLIKSFPSNIVASFHKFKADNYNTYDTNESLTLKEFLK